MPQKEQGSRPVVLVHGLVCNRGFWLPWMRELRKRSILYASVNLEPIWCGIDDYVGQIEEVVQRVEHTTGHKPVLICHSMGGLVVRAWLTANPYNAARIRKVVTIGTPHQGTWMARFSRSRSARQMRIGSQWLEDLRRHELKTTRSGEAGVPFTCWFSDTDNIVFPAEVGTLPEADNRCVPGVAHVALAFHPQVMAQTLDMVEATGRTNPPFDFRARA